MRTGHVHDDLTIAGGSGLILHDMRICNGPGYPALNIAMQQRSGTFLFELAKHDPVAADEWLGKMLRPDMARTFQNALFETYYPENGFHDERRFAEWFPAFEKAWSELRTKN